MKAIAFVVMIGFFAVLAARPHMRHGLRWGRTAGRHPVSMVGFYGFLLAFFLVFVSPFAVEYFGSNGWIGLVFVGAVVFMCAGLYDRLVRRYSTTPTSIWLRQGREWVELLRNEIAAVDFESVSRVIVRYYDGQRLVVSLYGFSNPSHDAVCTRRQASQSTDAGIVGRSGGLETMIHRRDFLFASGLSLLVATCALGQAQPQPSQSPAATRLLEALRGNRFAITMSDGPAGPGWDWLVSEARSARFPSSLK